MSDVNWRRWPGDPDRPALALHCMMGTAAYWGPIAARLNGCVDLQGFDMPSHGSSAVWAPQEDVDFHTAVTRIAAGAITCPLDLIGHSLGATVALRIAVAAPEAIRSLTLIEPVLFAAAPDPLQVALDDQIAARLAEGQPEQAARAFVDIWGARRFDELSPQTRRMMTEQIRLVADTDQTLTTDRARLLRDGGLESIDAPVMIIVGERSPSVVHRIADALAQRLGDVGRAIVPEAGHMLPLTHVAQTADLIALNLNRG